MRTGAHWCDNGFRLTGLLGPVRCHPPGAPSAIADRIREGLGFYAFDLPFYAGRGIFVLGDVPGVSSPTYDHYCSGVSGCRACTGGAQPASARIQLVGWVGFLMLLKPSRIRRTRYTS